MVLPLRVLYTAVHILHLGRCMNSNRSYTYEIVEYIQQYTQAFDVGFAG